MLESFFKESQKDVIRLLRRFVVADVFRHFPKWKDKAAIIVEGSVANGSYDQWSDIDLKVVLPPRLLKAYSKEEIQAYKARLREMGEPVQLHVPITYKALARDPDDWSCDVGLRERSRALVIVDPDGAYRAIQKTYGFYPARVLKEKAAWLVAEAVFCFEDRYRTAVKRGDRFFLLATELEIIRLLLNASLLISKQFPAFDKHLYQEVRRCGEIPIEIIRTVDKLMGGHGSSDAVALIASLMGLVQAYGVEKKVLKDQSSQAWLDARPKHRVTFV